MPADPQSPTDLLTPLERRVFNDVQVYAKELEDRVAGTDVEIYSQTREDTATANFFLNLSEDKGRKRLFVCCDGTWKNASGTTEPLTNVARFARAVDRFGINNEDPTSPIAQVIYYSGGVGSQSVLLLPVDRGYAGATGKGKQLGLKENTLNAYCFLSNNFNFAAADDNEIVLIWYSRGAFAVRCLADLISQIGLLRRINLTFLPVYFKRWREAKTDAARNRMKTNISKVGVSTFVKIKVLAEWDPVSAIGHFGWRKKYSFVEDRVPAKVVHAFQAVALNERRYSYRPMVWRKAGNITEVEQYAFVGCHGDIGGGNLDAGLSTVSLLWMAANIERVCGASLDQDALLQMIQPPQPSKAWWFSLKTKETEQMNLLWYKGNINETLKWWWLIPEVFTLGWAGGRRKRHLKKCLMDPGNRLTAHFTVRSLARRWPNRACTKLIAKLLDGEVRLREAEPTEEEKMLWELWTEKVEPWFPMEGDLGYPSNFCDEVEYWGKTFFKFLETEDNRVNEKLALLKPMMKISWAVGLVQRCQKAVVDGLKALERSPEQELDWAKAVKAMGKVAQISVQVTKILVEVTTEALEEREDVEARPKN